MQVVMRDDRSWTVLTGLALSLALTACAAAFATELEKVAFVSDGAETQINLYTDSIVPYSTVLSSPNKMVIDLRGIQTEDSVRTNFARAKNVSHVIFQPLNKNDVRMIIRGDHLGRAKINFRETANAQNTYANIDASPSSGGANALVIEDPDDAENLSSETSLTETRQSGDRRLVIEDLASDEPVHEAGSEAGAAAALSPLQIAKAAPADRANNSVTNVTRPLDLPAEESATEANALDSALSWVKGMNPWETGKAGLLGILLIGLGLFLKRKMTTLKTSEEMLPVAERKLSFRELAQNRRNLAQADGGDDRIFSPNRHPKKANPWASRPALQSASKQPLKKPVAKKPSSGSPIGLNALMNTMGLSNKPADIQASQPGPAAQKQVLNQYKKQAAPVQKPRQMPAQKKVLRNEAQRSAEVKSRLQKPAGTEARQKLGKRPLAPQGSKNEPIPDNPQVLEFLRNVADLMEKDGDTAKAQRIQKNLKNPG